MTTSPLLSPSLEAEIKSACYRVALDYSYYADKHRMTDVAALFAEDGKLEAFGQIHVGRADILACLSEDGDAITAHILTNYRIDVLSDGEAESTSYVTFYLAGRSAPLSATIEPLMVGTYHDVYTRTLEGWRFANRSFKPLFTRKG